MRFIILIIDYKKGTNIMRTRKTTKLTAIILSALMIFAIMPISVSAQPSGEAITSASDFAAMQANGSYYLANDIEINSESDNTSAYTGVFKGTFNGNGKTVETNIPLFESVDGATVENLTVKGTVTDMAAVVCYISGNATFKNITNEASVCGNGNTLNKDNSNVTLKDSATGGIAGIIVGTVEGGTTVTFENCINKGAVEALSTTGASSTGGILGAAIFHANLLNAGDESELLCKVKIVFKSCSNQGKIESKSHAGGIFGFASSVKSITFENCTNSEKIISNVDAGGLLGKVENSSAMKANDCSNSADISTTAEPVGGMVGVSAITTADNYIINCTNRGAITTTGTGDVSDAGGIVGYSTGNVINIVNCSNSGNVTGYAPTAGIIGMVLAGATVTGCTNSGEVKTEGSINVNLRDSAGIVGYSKIAINITDCGNEGEISGKNTAAGIIARVIAGATIKNCYNTKAITCDGNYAGGIVAHENNSDLDIYYCYNTGAITGQQYVGGIAGRMNNANATIVGCYNSGTVEYTNKSLATNKYACAQIAHIGTYGTLADNFYNEGLAQKAFDKPKDHEAETENNNATPYVGAKLSTGELTYAMNDAISDTVGKTVTVYYQNINEGGATKDANPVLDSTHGYVFMHTDNKLYSLAFHTLNKASIRLDATNHGMRFSTAVNKADYEVLEGAGIELSLGTIITPDAYLQVALEGGYTFTKTGLGNLDTANPYLDVSPTGTGTDVFMALRGVNDPDNYYFHGSISSIDKDNYGWDYSAVGYVIINGKEIYSADHATRNIAYVANAAYNDTETGYTTDELDIIKTYLAAN